MRRCLMVATWFALVATQPLTAQAGAQALTRAVQAYQSLDYASAVEWLGQSLRPGPSGALSSAERRQALSYLGAAEFFRGQRPAAIAAFQEIIRSDPDAGLDTLVFPPQVTTFYDSVQGSTPAIVIDAPAEAELAPQGDPLSIRVRSVAVDDLIISVIQGDTTLIRQLYAGPAPRSLVATWDGFGSAGSLREGRYLLRVHGTGRRGERVVEVPIDLNRAPTDTVPWPTPPPSSPGPASRPPDLRPGRSLAAGLVTGGAVALLPTLVSTDPQPMAGRWGIGIAAAVAGVAVFVAGRSRDRDIRPPLSEDMDRALAAARAENARRRAAAPIQLKLGPATDVTPESP
ncbi:MAG: tol-pal system YbgF family protein [Gemmatimonadales bacterium]